MPHPKSPPLLHMPLSTQFCLSSSPPCGDVYYLPTFPASMAITPAVYTLPRYQLPPQSCDHSGAANPISARHPGFFSVASILSICRGSRLVAGSPLFHPTPACPHTIPAWVHRCLLRLRQCSSMPATASPVAPDTHDLASANPGTATECNVLGQGMACCAAASCLSVTTTTPP